MNKTKLLLFTWILLISLCCVAAVALGSETTPARVLLISSYHPEFPTFYQQINGIKSVFDPKGILLDVEFMDKKRFADEENEAYFLNHLTYKLQRSKPYNVVMTADDDALLFLLMHKKDLFPSQPAIFLGVNNIATAKAQNERKDITGVIEDVSMQETVQMMLDLNPGTKRIIALVDTTPSSMGDLLTFKQLAPSFPQVSFTQLSLGDHSFDEFAKELHKIDKEAAVLLLSSYVDKTGRRMRFEDSLRLILDNLQTPLFHLWYHGLGKGILGGKVISHQQQGKTAAEIAVRILGGEPVESIKVVEKSPNINVIDYSVLKKFYLNDKRLPENTTFLNKPYSLYEQYQSHFWAGVIFFLSQMLIIIFLVRVIGKIKKTESALRESENRYASFFKNNHSVILLLNPNSGVIVDLNPAACHFYGYAREEIVGKNLTILNPLPFAQLQEALAAARSMERNHFFLQHRLATGEIRDVEVYSGPIMVSGEEMLCSIVHDITERRKAEQAVKERELFLAAILQTAAEGFWVLDTRGIINEVNGAYCAMTGYTKQELIGMPINTIDAHESIFGVGERIARIIANGSELFETEHCRKDGSVFPVEISAAYLPENGGQFINFCRDLTERKLTEEKLRTTLERTQIILSNIQLGLMLVNSENTIEFINQSCCDLFAFGTPPAQVIGVPAAEITAKVVNLFAEPERATVRIQELIENNVPVLNDEIHLSGDRTLLRDFVPIVIDGKPYGRLWYYYDITEQRKAQGDRKRLEEQLVQAQKMEAIGTLAGGIAHDFNNILGAVIGYAEMAKDACIAGTKVDRDLGMVLEAAQRAAGLVRQILAFSRQAETKRIKMEPALIVKEAVKLLRSTIPSTITLETHIKKNPLYIVADPVQLQQVVMNLCTNAYHAMEQTGGTIRIELSACTLSGQDLLAHPRIVPGSFIRLTVSDTGPGIPLEIQEKIFEPYFTTKEVGKGTGLGLAIVHGIVSSSGGFITYAGTTGEGSIFHIYFPEASREPILEPTTQPISLAGSGQILFVDDEEMLAEMGQAMLERLGYRVTIQTSSLEALATFEHTPDSFDAVITDQTMPGMTGAEMARKILQIRPQIPIILCTGYSNLINEEQAKKMGIKGFVMKPLTKKVLGTLLKAVLDDPKTTGRQSPT
ncbi:MAG: ABC transporter substrate binding protein [Desulfobulbus sp.]|nr:ABC transporter substrate binding protein [Desulfobulbus sp.]